MLLYVKIKYGVVLSVFALSLNKAPISLKAVASDVLPASYWFNISPLVFMHTFIKLLNGKSYSFPFVLNTTRSLHQYAFTIVPSAKGKPFK